MSLTVVTSGIRRVWSKVLQKYGLSNAVTLVGGCKSSDEYVVTPQTKAGVVDFMRGQLREVVFAFGGSPVDLPMLQAANYAYVVGEDEAIRSKSMEKKLADAIAASQEFRPTQILFPSGVSHRLDEKTLPITDIMKPDFLNKLIQTGSSQLARIEDASISQASKLLAGPTRASALNSVALRQAHHRIGYFLAINHISNITGLEAYEIPHVTGGTTTAHRFLHEAKTTIVALMRAGEPLASGVSEAMPQAMFVHAKQPIDLVKAHLINQRNIILADFVINSGKTVEAFIESIRKHTTARIIVVAGVVQQDFIDGRNLEKYVNVRLVTLRRSEDKYTGKEISDTGHRLFNTIHMD